MTWPRGLLSNAYSRAGRAAQNARGRGALGRLGYHRLFDLRPPNSIPPVWGDLWHLYQTVLERKPSLILEFGSGCSTIIMAQGLVDNGTKDPAKIVSLESESRWAKISETTIPDALGQFVEIIVAPVDKAEHSGVPVWRHQNVPVGAPDLVYLDGPALTPDRKIAVDMLDMEDRLAPGTRLIVDGRSRNCRFLADEFSRRWSRSWNRFTKQTTFDLLA